MDDFKILSFNDILDLNIFKRYGFKAEVTDFAKLLGCKYNWDSSSNRYCGSWWTVINNNNVFEINSNGDIKRVNPTNTNIGARLAIDYKKIKIFAKNKKEITPNIIEVECFSYPSYVVSKEEQKCLETKFINEKAFFESKTNKYPHNSLSKTDKYYKTYDQSGNYGITRYCKTFDEYFIDNQKYIRFVADKNIDSCLSNKTLIKKNYPYWIKVEPIKFIVDKKRNIAITKDIVFSGIKFNFSNEYFESFDSTEMSLYLNSVFSENIIPSDKFVLLGDTKVKLISGDNFIFPHKKEKKFENEYTSGINKEEETEIYLKLKGMKKDIIEELKKINRDLVEVSIEDKKEIVRSRGHYGYKK